MRTLLLLRHAKAEPADHDMEDIARALTSRGHDDARQVGDWLKKTALIPDAIITSTATRARQTAEDVAESCGFLHPLQFHSDLYLAEPEVYLHLLRGWADDESIVLMVGHNDGIEQLVSSLCGSSQVMQTASLAHLRFPWTEWGQATLSAAGVLVELWRPEHRHH